VVATDNYLLAGIFPPPAPTRQFASGKQTCVQTNHQEYGGVQVGADIAKLNIGSSGINWHFGVTAGYLGAKLKDTTGPGLSGVGVFPFGETDAGDLKSRFEVPFVGVTSTLTQGNFFTDVQARWDFYQSTSSSAIQSLSGVENDARGFLVSGSLGYRITHPSNWFVEPSVGGSWSRVKVDPVRLVGTPGGLSDCRGANPGA
jgi:hypothetical protein